jgi:cob(II)yrinic acid a,c-diamide reductase
MRHSRRASKVERLLSSFEIDPARYRDAMSGVAGHVHVVTTDGPAGRRGVTVSAVTSVSDQPPTVLVCLNKAHPRNHLFDANGVFALNTLGTGHEALARAFAGEGKLENAQRFALGEWTTAVTGSAILADAMATFDCEIIDARDVATHRVMIARVKALTMRSGSSPLLYFQRGYTLLPISTGTNKAHE